MKQLGKGFALGAQSTYHTHRILVTLVPGNAGGLLGAWNGKHTWEYW